MSQAIQLKPDEPLYYEWRGEMYSLSGHPGKARADYRKALKVAPKDWPHRLRVGELLRKLGDE